MPLGQKAIIKQIDDILYKSNLVSPGRFHDFSDVADQELSEAINLLYSAIDRLAPIRKMVNLKGINQDKQSTVPCYRPSGTVTLAVNANLGPAKLPDIRASFATCFVSYIPSCILFSRTAVAEQKNLQACRRMAGKSRRCQAVVDTQ
jgi:hypothetical protein